jgi:hypothetical protein
LLGFAILLFTPRWACLVVLDLFLNFWLSWNWDLGDSNSCLALCDGDGCGNGMGASEELVKKEDMAAWRRLDSWCGLGGRCDHIQGFGGWDDADADQFE